MAPWPTPGVLENISPYWRYLELLCSFFRYTASAWNHFSLHWGYAAGDRIFGGPGNDLWRDIR
jgi:hypothetical protein